MYIIRPIYIYYTIILLEQYYCCDKYVESILAYQGLGSKSNMILKLAWTTDSNLTKKIKYCGKAYKSVVTCTTFSKIMYLQKYKFVANHLENHYYY